MLRAFFTFLAVPGTVAGILPFLLSHLPIRPGCQSPLFTFTAILGLLILTRCVVSFYHRGRGTLAPWDPPQRLVVEDLYRHNRNPMYVGVVLILLSWAGLLGSTWHYLYAVVVFTMFNAFILLYEEPTLAKQFPKDWPNYKKNVPRWLVRIKPYKTEEKSHG